MSWWPRSLCDATGICISGDQSPELECIHCHHRWVLNYLIHMIDGIQAVRVRAWVATLTPISRLSPRPPGVRVAYWPECINERME